MAYMEVSPTLEELQARIATIRARMEKAALESGRDPASVRLCAACKTRTVETVRLSAQCDIDLFGENHVQELVEKKDANAYLGKSSHFIGHLQTNKVKQIVPFVSMIHSIDTPKLLQEINKAAEHIDRKISCLLQIHIAREESKFGFSFEECREYLRSGAWKDLHSVQLCGVMGMATLTDDREQIKSEFLSLHKFFNEIKKDYFSEDESFREISMGMSDDYPLAIEAGSTLVRIGSRIFGERVY